MRILLLLCCFCLFLNCESIASNTTYSVSLGAGSRSESLTTLISSQDDNPLIEIKWRDLKIKQVRLFVQAEYVPPKRSYLTSILQIELSAGSFTDGRFSEAEFIDNNQDWVYSRSQGESEGETLTIKPGVGVRFRLGRTGLSVGPRGGLIYHDQKLNMTDGVQIYTDQPLYDTFVADGRVLPTLGQLTGLNNRYNAEYYGAYFGIDFNWILPYRKVQVRLIGEYMSLKYKADANWNLRSDLNHPKSFDLEGDDIGTIGTFVVSYNPWPHVGVELTLSNVYWRVENGDSRVYYADGTSSKYQLDKVKRGAISRTLSVRVAF